MAPRPRATRLGAAALAACLAAAPAVRGAAVEPAAAVDLARFFGRWYVIAHAPAARPPPVAAYFEYRPRDDGLIDDLYFARPGAFAEEPVALRRTASADPERPARWEIRSGWFGSVERWVLYVSADYRYALAGAPAGNEAWVLAREPVIPEWSYAGLLARLALQGYDVSRFRRVVQVPGQVGLPGFE